MNIVVFKAQIAAAFIVVLEVPIGEYPAIKTRVFVYMRMVSGLMRMAVDDDFASCRAKRLRNFGNDHVHICGVFLLVIGFAL